MTSRLMWQNEDDIQKEWKLREDERVEMKAARRTEETPLVSQGGVHFFTAVGTLVYHFPKWAGGGRQLAII